MKPESLIFLISQPRSGSSLLQQLMLSSGRIHSIPEPWFMLSLVATYKRFGVNKAFNFDYAQINLERYLEASQSSLETYKERLRQFALDVYGLGANPRKEFFLDKTPRYYHIIPELSELFPEAKFVFIVRNPLAVFHSTVNYVFKRDLHRMLLSPDRMDDLLVGPKRVLEAKRTGAKNSFFVRYEELVRDPGPSLEGLSKFLGIPLRQDGRYELDEVFAKSVSIDKKSLSLHEKPVAAYAETWRDSQGPLPAKMAVQYLDRLGRETVEGLGYDFDALREQARQLPKTQSRRILGFMDYFNYHRHYSFRTEAKFWLARKFNPKHD